MNDSIRLDLSELADEAEYLASMSLMLEDATNYGASSCSDYAGAVHLFNNLMHEHKRKLKALASGEATA